MITDLVRGYTSNDAEMNQIAMYYVCAQVFGFTPAEVDSIDAKTIQGMVMFNTAKCVEEAEMMKKASRK